VRRRGRSALRGLHRKPTPSCAAAGLNFHFLTQKSDPVLSTYIFNVEIKLIWTSVARFSKPVSVINASMFKIQGIDKGS
jgi:hypothetical protein